MMTHPPHRVSLRRLLLVVAAVNVVTLAATVTLEQWYRTAGKSFDELPWTKWPLVLLQLGREQTLGAWWPAALLAAAGALFLLRALQQRLDSEARTAGIWSALGGLALLALSLDELASVHERVFGREGFRVDGHAAWLATGLPLVALAVVPWWRMGPGSKGLLPAWFGALLLPLSSLGLLHALGTSLYASARHPLWPIVVDQASKLLGASLLLFGAIIAVRATESSVSTSERVGSRIRAADCWAAATATGVALVLLTAVGDRLQGQQPTTNQLGLLQWWTGSMAAGLLALAAFTATRLAEPREKPPLFLLTWYGGLLSVLYGIDGFGWIAIAGGRAELALRAAACLSLALPAIWLIRTRPLAGAATAAAAVAPLLGTAAAGPLEVLALSAAAALLAGSRKPQVEPVTLPTTGIGWPASLPSSVAARPSAGPGRPTRAAPRVR